MKDAEHEQQPLTSAHAELSPLSRIQQLLAETRAFVERATHEAARHAGERQQRAPALEQSVREMEELLGRTERDAAQLANLYAATYRLHASRALKDSRAADESASRADSPALARHF